MKVDEPRFGEDGELVGCSDCPLAAYNRACQKWLEAHRFDEREPGRCPTADTYAEACQAAEAARRGE